MGEWFSTYQRLTHYFRALDIWHPAPHLLALAVLERAVSRAERDQGLTPLRLAMTEVHALLGRQAPGPHNLADASPDWQGSVCWRIGSWLADGGERDLLRDVGEVSSLRPVPGPALGPMVPQPLEASPLTRAVRAAAAGIRQLRLGAGWRRRHA